jgi:anaerobic selenocysteine-containing dehydrogenase
MDAAAATTRTIRTACNRDCPDACSILVDVGADGRALRLRGDPDDPVTRGFLCERTSRFLERQYASDRFTQPMVRRERGGPLASIGWHDALELAATKLRQVRAESGPAAILHYRSGGSLGLFKLAADFLFEQFGPVTTKRGDVCSGAGEHANLEDFGVSDSNDLFDLRHSELIVVWGKDVHTSGPHLLPLLNEAKRRGATIVGVDPIRTKVASLCDVFLQPRPGSDGAIALAVARRLFDEGGAVDAAVAKTFAHGVDEFRALARSRTLEERAREADVPAADLRRFADLYATRRPGAILVGWGLARRHNGSATVRTLDALAVVSGNAGVAGGGASYYFARRAAFETSFVKGERAAPRTFVEPKLGEEIERASEPPVRAIWITAGNPVSMLPDSDRVKRALERTEFVVVVDTHPTDTTDAASLVLPCLTLIEDEDLLGAYGNHWLRASQRAVEPPSGARHELEILRELAVRLGIGDRFPSTIGEWRRHLLRKVERHGVTAERLACGPVRSPLAKQVLFESNRFATQDAKARLIAKPPAPARGGDRDFPLQLFAGSTPKSQSSQWSVPVERTPPVVRVHPDSASGLRDGAVAILESRIARLAVTVRHDATLRRELAVMAKGGMLRDGRCANRLIAAALTDEGEGAAYYDEPVRLVAS